MDGLESRFELVRSESEQLKRYLYSLPPDAWSRPGACHRWEVRDVVAHLAGGAEFYAAMISRGMQGDSSPPNGLPAAGGVNGVSFAETIAQRAISLREQLTDHLLSTYEALDAQLTQLTLGLGAQDWDKPCYHPGGILPVRTFAVLRLMELSIHGWAIRSSLNPLAHVSSESLPVLMELMPEALGWFFQPGPTLPAPVRYRFELTGSRPGSYDIVGHGDKAHLEPAGTAQPNVTFRCETETFVLLMLGRLNLSAATADGRTVVEGDHGLTAEFSQWFRGA